MNSSGPFTKSCVRLDCWAEPGNVTLEILHVGDFVGAGAAGGGDFGFVADILADQAAGEGVYERGVAPPAMNAVTVRAGSMTETERAMDGWVMKTQAGCGPIRTGVKASPARTRWW